MKSKLKASLLGKIAAIVLVFSGVAYAQPPGGMPVQTRQAESYGFKGVQINADYEESKAIVQGWCPNMAGVVEYGAVQSVQERWDNCISIFGTTATISMEDPESGFVEKILIDFGAYNPDVFSQIRKTLKEKYKVDYAMSDATLKDALSGRIRAFMESYEDGKIMAIIFMSGNFRPVMQVSYFKPGHDEIGLLAPVQKQLVDYDRAKQSKPKASTRDDL